MLTLNVVFPPSLMKTYKEGRICVVCGCKLSMYNKDKTCWPCQRTRKQGKEGITTSREMAKSPYND